MDRNQQGRNSQNIKRVALRKESVDRNRLGVGCLTMLGGVALRKESVDRNFDTVQIVIIKVVALRKESVDRNYQINKRSNSTKRRSPQGERG